jgi:hypothetical protein
VTGRDGGAAGDPVGAFARDCNACSTLELHGYARAGVHVTPMLQLPPVHEE